MTTLFEDLHGITMWVAWNVFGFIGILIAHFKFTESWYKIHVIMMNIAVLLTIAGFIFIKHEEERETKPFHLAFHKAVGVVLLILIGLQPINGYFRPDKESWRRKYWEYFHKNVGRSIIVLTMASMILTGLKTLDIGVKSRLFILQIVYCGVITAIFVMMKLLFTKKLVEQVSEANQNVEEIVVS